MSLFLVVAFLFYGTLVLSVLMWRESNKAIERHNSQPAEVFIPPEEWRRRNDKKQV